MSISKVASLVLAFALLASVAPVRAQSVIPDFRLSPKTFFEANTHFKDKRQVFAWYMVCCGPFGGNSVSKERQVGQYKAEIQMAQSMGIDGFGLDIMQPNTEYHTAIEALFQAAKELNSGFKLFFELDYGNPDKVPSDYADLVRQYAKSSNYVRVSGRPLVCAYAADTGEYGAGKGVSWWNGNDPNAAIAWWRKNLIEPLKANGTEICFVPTTWWQLVLGGGSDKTSQEEISAWGDTAQGYSMWQIQNSPIGGGLPVLERHSLAMRQVRKTWMATIATHYWVGSSRSVPGWYWQPGQPLKPDVVNGKYFEHAGGEGLEAQWKSVIDVQKPAWVMMLTWNDYNESYIEPIDDYKKYSNGTAQGAPLGWYKPQTGLDELNRYYVQWYKTGKVPKITADSLFYAYRTHSQSLVATNDNRPPVGIGNGPIGDDIYVTTALTAPAKLRVESGSSSTEFDVPAGIAHTKTPFHVGKQSFSLSRDGAKLAAVDGEPVVDSIMYYDYWPTTGFVEAEAKH